MLVHFPLHLHHSNHSSHIVSFHFTILCENPRSLYVPHMHTHSMKCAFMSTGEAVPTRASLPYTASETEQGFRKHTGFCTTLTGLHKHEHLVPSDWPLCKLD
jgi:hypothetical protein